MSANLDLVRMSANLDLARSIYADWERGDFSSVGWADPDIEFVLADRPDAGTWSGVAGMAEGMRQLLSALEDFCVAADESRERRGFRARARGRARKDERAGASSS